jgi:predicted permease
MVGTLVDKIYPLYLVILLGFFAGKYFHVNRESVANLLIYLITPSVMFFSVTSMELNPEVLGLPLIFCVLASVLALIWYKFTGFIYSGSEKNILAFAAGTGNTGYFGLPLLLALFSEDLVGIAMVSVLGFVIFENSLGYYLVAKGHYSSKQALQKLLGLPAIYSFILALLLNTMHFQFGPEILTVAAYFKGAYVVLGMMLIGLGISQMTKFEFDFQFCLLAFIMRFAIWPLLVLSIIKLDQAWWGIFNSDVYKVMIVMSVVPLASNGVAYAVQLRTHPEKIALTILLSTIFALLFIPWYMAWVLPWLCFS